MCVFFTRHFVVYPVLSTKFNSVSNVHRRVVVFYVFWCFSLFSWFFVVFFSFFLIFFVVVAGFHELPLEFLFHTLDSTTSVYECNRKFNDFSSGQNQCVFMPDNAEKGLIYWTYTTTWIHYKYQITFSNSYFPFVLLIFHLICWVVALLLPQCGACKLVFLCVCVWFQFKRSVTNTNMNNQLLAPKHLNIRAIAIT